MSATVIQVVLQSSSKSLPLTYTNLAWHTFPSKQVSAQGDPEGMHTSVEHMK